MKKILFLSLAACAALLAESEPLPKYNHKINIGLLNLGYEYTKADTVYAGVDGNFSSLWLSKNDNSYQQMNYINFEMRLGYNISVGVADSITPYFSGGHTYFDSEKEAGNIINWTYGAAGVKYIHDFGNIFSMALHVKGAMSLIEKKYVFKDYSMMKITSYNDMHFFPMVGIGMIWHFGDTRNWEINLEPYYTQIPNSNTQHIIGSKLLLGCRY
jgi:hypothetical protein